MIELGRCQIDHVPRENTLCLWCKSKQIEDENHFLLLFAEEGILTPNQRDCTRH